MWKSGGGGGGGAASCVDSLSWYNFCLASLQHKYLNFGLPVTVCNLVGKFTQLVVGWGPGAQLSAVLILCVGITFVWPALIVHVSLFLVLNDNLTGISVSAKKIRSQELKMNLKTSWAQTALTQNFYGFSFFQPSKHPAMSIVCDVFHASKSELLIL